MSIAVLPETRKRFYTPDEYLVFELAAEQKHELHGEEIVGVSGASREHNLIVSHLVYALMRELMESDSEVYAGDMRVRTGERMAYAYPDVVVAKEPVFDSPDNSTLLNPTVLIEVLSHATEARDRGAKWKAYQTLDSLNDYLLVDPYRPRVERFARTGLNEWVYSNDKGPDAVIEITSLGCRLALQDIYKRVVFPDTARNNTDDNEQG